MGFLVSTWMRYSETLQLFGQAFEFPIEKEAVVEQLGSVELIAPTGDTVTVRAVLERTDDTTYHSKDELFISLMGNLEDGFIGRKYYDDRSGDSSGVSDVREDDMSL